MKAGSTRRKYLWTIGAAVGSIPIAGCLGDGNGDDETDTEESDPDADVEISSDQEQDSDETADTVTLEPTVDYPDTIEIGDQFVLDATGSDGNIEEFEWELQAFEAVVDDELITISEGGERVHIRYESTEMDTRNFSLTVRNGDVQETVEENIEIEMWDNTDFRLRHIGYWPDPKMLSDRSDYGISISDDQAIRAILPEESLETRVERFNRIQGISDIIDYEEIRGTSYADASSMPMIYEVYDLDSAKDSIESELSEVRSEESFSVYEGELSTLDGGDPVTREYLVTVFPEENIIISGRTEQVFENYELETEERMDKILDSIIYQMNSLDRPAEDYIESSQFTKEGIVTDRLGTSTRVGNWREIPSDYRKDQGVDALNEGIYDGFYVYPVVYDKERGMTYEQVKGPYGESGAFDGPRPRPLDEVFEHDDFKVLEQFESSFIS